MELSTTSSFFPKVGNFSLLDNVTSELEPGFTTCTWYLTPLEWVKLVTLVIGTAGNGLVVVAIIAGKELHTKTYCVICAIAVADCIYCTSAVLWSTLLFAYLDYTNYRQYVKCINDILYTLMNTVISVLFSASYIASGLSISLLSIIRFVVITKPLRANVILRNRFIALSLLLIWLFSLGIGVWKNLPIQILSRVNSSIVDTLVSYVLPLLTIIVFHGIKISRLKQSEYRKSDVQKMEKLVVVIILAFCICNLPWQILRLLSQYEIYVPGYVVQSLTGYLLQLNNCVNPIFYAFLSPNIRRSIGAWFSISR